MITKFRPQPRDEAPNGAQVLFLCDGASSTRLGDFARRVILFDGKDAEALAAGRTQWRALMDSGHDLSYWQQDEQGRWDRKTAG